jgi:hypothetical protein
MIVKFWKRGRMIVRKVKAATTALTGYGRDYGNNYGG